MPGIKEGTDGSITLYLQSDSPGKDKESNWLPTLKHAQFNMALRCYGPGEPIIQQTWQPPTVSKVQ
jgi:hypothetical protein